MAAPDAYAQAVPPASSQWPIPFPQSLPTTHVLDEKRTVGHPYPVPLHAPSGIAFNSSGHLLVVDSGSSSIKVFDTPNMTTVNASGSFGSKGTNFLGEIAPGLFNRPFDMAVNSENTIYVVDQYGNRVQVFDANGTYVAQIPPQRTQFAGADGAFFSPVSIAMGDDDMFYVGESFGRVQAFHPNGTFAYKIGEIPSFAVPVGNQIYANGLGVNGTHVFVADAVNGRVLMYNVSDDMSGAALEREIKMPRVHGHVDAAPEDVAINGTDMYVTDFYGQRVYKYDLRTATGDITNETAMIGDSGAGEGELRNPESVAVRNGLVYVSDSGHNRIMAYHANGTYANITIGYEMHAADELSGPFYVRVSDDGSTLIVSDTGNAQVKEFVLDASDGTYGHNAAFTDHIDDPNFLPTGIAVDDDAGRIYVLNHFRTELYVFNSTLGLVGVPLDISGSARQASGLALGGDGRLVVTSIGNGNVSTFDVNGSLVSNFNIPSPFGVGLSAAPADVEFDRDGNLVIMEQVGRGVGVRDRDGSLLYYTDANRFYPLYQPSGVAVDPNGRIIVANNGAGTIDVYDHAGGFVSRVGSHGDGPGEFETPQDVDSFGNGTLVVADLGNHRVQFLEPTDTTPPTVLSVSFGGILGLPTSLYPHGPGGLIAIDVKFSEPIRTFTRAGGEAPSIGLETGAKDARAVMFGTGAQVLLPADTVRFLYTVGHGEASFALDYADGNPFDLGDGAITDLHGNRADLTVPPAGSEGSLSGAASMEQVRRSNPFTLNVAALFYGAGHVLGGINVAGGPEVVQVIGEPFAVDLPAPTDVAFSPDGSLLYVSVRHHDAVRVYNTADGEYVRQIGGVKNFFGRVIGNPEGIAVNSTGHVFVAESGNARVSVWNPDGTGAYPTASRLNPDLTPTNVFGAYDFTNGSGSLQFPTDVAFDEDGMIYVADQGHRRVDVFNPDWTSSHTLGAAGDMRLSEPIGLAYEEATGRLFVADARADRTLVFENPGSPGANRIVDVIAGTSEATNTPYDIAIGPDGRVFISSHFGHAISIYERSGSGYAYAGRVNTAVGGDEGDIFWPKGIGFGPGGRLYVADSGNDRVKVLAFGAANPNGAFERTIGEDAHEPDEFAHPFDADARDGRLVVADTENDRMVVFDTNRTGQYEYNFTIGGDGEDPLSVSPVCRDAGDRDCRGSDDGKLAFPAGVAIAADGSIYVSDYGNHRLKIFDSSGGHVRTIYEIAGKNVSFPSKIDINATGHVFVADSGNHRIAVMDSAGAGLYAFGSQGAGPGQFERPTGLAVGPDNRIVVSDTFNRRVQVFEADGTYAGTVGAQRTYDYPNPGELLLPHGVDVDKDGRIIVTDARVNRLQIYDASGAPAYWFDAIGEVQGAYDDPYGVAVDDSTGRIIVVDSGNSRVQVHSFADTTAPRAMSASAAAVPGAEAGSEGSAVDVSVKFSEPVRVQLARGGIQPPPSIPLNTEPRASEAVYASGSGTDTLVFRYTVRAGEAATALDFADPRIMVPSKAYIADIWGNAADPSLSGLSLAGAGISIDAAPAGQLRIGLLTADATSPQARAAVLAADDFNAARAAGAPPVALSVHVAPEGGARATMEGAYSGGSGPSVFVSTLPDSELALASGGGQSAYSYANASGLAILSTSLASASLPDGRLYSLAPTADGLALALASRANGDGVNRTVVVHDASGSYLQAPVAAALRSVLGSGSMVGDPVNVGASNAPAADIGRALSAAGDGTAVVYLGSAETYARIASDAAGALRSAPWYAAGTVGGTASGSIAASPVLANSPPALSLASDTMLKVVSFAPAPSDLSRSIDMRLVLPDPGSSQGAYAAYDAVRVAGAAAAAEGSATNATAVGMRVPQAATGYSGALGSIALSVDSGELAIEDAYATWTVTREAEWNRMGGLTVSRVCSVELGMDNMAFGDVNVGEMSGIMPQVIMNTGTLPLSSVTADPTAWSSESTQLNANLTEYRMKPGMTMFKPLNPGDMVASNVPYMGSQGLDFQVDLTGVTAERDMTITQTITYTATCG